MFHPLIELRLVVIDSLNSTPDQEQATTARAWVDILELEAAKLIDRATEWVPIAATTPTVLRLRHAHRWGRLLGNAEARLSLIIADQAVAALIRGHLASETETVA